MNNAVYEKFELYHSSISKQLVKYEINGAILTGITNDGKKVLYNSFLDNIRYLPNDPAHMTDEEYKSEFKFRVRAKMVREGINQFELSRRTEISQSVLSGYLSGRNMPSYQNAAKIARALHCSLDDFVYEG